MKNTMPQLLVDTLAEHGYDPADVDEWAYKDDGFYVRLKPQPQRVNINITAVPIPTDIPPVATKPARMA